MGLLGDVINDVVTVVGNVPDVVNDTLSLDVSGVVDDVVNVVDDTVDTVKHVVVNLLGTSDTGNDVPPTAEPAPTSSPTDPSSPNAPTVTNSSTNGNPPPSNPTSTSTSSPHTNPGEETSSTSSASTGDGEDSGSTTVGGTPAATGTVQPNPVALPHAPSGGDSDGSSSSDTNTGTGTGANGGGNAPGGTLPDGGGDKNLNKGAVAGIAIVSAFVGLAVVMCLVRFYFVRRRRGKRHEWAQRSTMMVQAHANAVTTPAAPRLSSDSGDVESGRAPRESYHSGSSSGHGAPARESYHSDDGPATVESFHSGAVSVGTTHESSLFTGPPPMPSWSRASRTQQRRVLREDGESSSAENENFGTIIPDSRIAWTAPRSPPPIVEEPHSVDAAGVVYQTRHANTHLMDDAISLSETSSGCVTVESGSSFAASSSMSQAASTDSVDMHESGLVYARSPSPQELPARGSTHLSGEYVPNWLGGSSPASTPTSTTFSASSSTTPLMTQLNYRSPTLSVPMAVPLHMIVPSQSPPPPPSVPLPVPPHMIVPSQSPPPQEPRTLSVMFAQADPFASPHDKPHRV